MKKKYTILADDLNKIALNIEEIMKDNDKLSAAYDTIGENNMSAIYKNASDLFKKMIKPCNDYQKIISENFKQLFRYYHHQLSTIEEVASECEKVKDSYKDFESKLTIKKSQLFEEKESTYWNINLNPFKKLTQSQALESPEVPYDETKDLKKWESLHGYYCNKLMEEIKKIDKNNGKIISEKMLIGLKDFSTTLASVLSTLVKYYLGKSSLG